jgi:hypothetical protein
MTKGEKILQSYKTAAAAFDRFVRLGYSVEDLRVVMNDIGVSTELFIKDAVFGKQKDKQNYEKLVDALPGLGLSQGDAQSLHGLRRVYNLAHHNNDIGTTLAQAQVLVAAAEAAVAWLVASNVGDVNADSRPGRRHLFWLAAWFHVNGGDVEVNILVPDDSIRTTWAAFDQIFIKLDGWDAIVAELDAVGTLNLGRGTIPDPVYDRFDEVGDLVAAGTFEGGYGDLMSILAKHEDRQDLFPLLLRENDRNAMFQAVLLAMIDVATERPPSHDEAAVAEWLSEALETRYAAPRHAKYLERLVPIGAHILAELPDALWPVADGPTFVDSETYDDLVEGAVSSGTYESIRIAFLGDGTLLSV